MIFRRALLTPSCKRFVHTTLYAHGSCMSGIAVLETVNIAYYILLGLPADPMIYAYASMQHAK